MLQWSEKYATGFPHIDADHRDFLQRAAALRTAIDHGAGPAKIAELLALLQEHALRHFQREEVLMAQVGCPAHASNCAAHREFARKLEGWTQLLCLSNASASLLSDIHREATQWMEQHIACIDCELRRCRREGGPAWPLAAR